MKKLLIILLIFSSIHLFSQEKVKKFNYQFGFGLNHFNDEENLCISFENEINYKLNKYFSNSISVSYGKDILKEKGLHVTSYLQGSINIYFSPLKNNKKNDFKIGTGYTYINYNEINNFDPEINSFDLENYTLFKNKLSLLNFIFEYNYSINNKYIIGLNSYSKFNNITQFIEVGLMLKLGVVL